MLSAGLIKEVGYPTWLENVVLVKKSNGRCKMYVDFTDVNIAYPKDHYPLLTIDKLADAITSHTICFLVDAISGYHQIKIDLDDEEQTAFVTNLKVYCYNVIPFELKNAGATYQLLLNKMFANCGSICR